jgi:hypothetical protein
MLEVTRLLARVEEVGLRTIFSKSDLKLPFGGYIKPANRSAEM